MRYIYDLFSIKIELDSRLSIFDRKAFETNFDLITEKMFHDFFIVLLSNQISLLKKSLIVI